MNTRNLEHPTLTNAAGWWNAVKNCGICQFYNEDYGRHFGPIFSETEKMKIRDSYFRQECKHCGAYLEGHQYAHPHFAPRHENCPGYQLDLLCQDIL